MENNIPFTPSLCIPSSHVEHLAVSWLREDCPSFDVAAVVAGSARRTATLYAKSPLVVAGTSFFSEIFKQVNCKVIWKVKDGDEIMDASAKQKVELGKVEGEAHAILRGERVALNAIAECSSVASTARQAVKAVQKTGWTGTVAGTRKTSPGLRLLQKYGMVVGGIDAHRFDLSSMVMIKDNHIQASGGITVAVETVRRISGFSLKIDVEAEDEKEAIEACQAGADIVMLDNFEISELKRVASRVKHQWPAVLVEASGGVSMDNLENFCDTCVDVISFSINRHAKPVDMSLKLDSL